MHENAVPAENVTQDERTDLIYVVCSKSFLSNLIKDINYTLTEKYLLIKVRFSLIFFRLNDLRKANIDLKMAPAAGWSKFSAGLPSIVERVNLKTFSIFPQQIQLSDFFDKKYLKVKI